MLLMSQSSYLERRAEREERREKRRERKKKRVKAHDFTKYFSQANVDSGRQGLPSLSQLAHSPQNRIHRLVT